MVRFSTGSTSSSRHRATPTYKLFDAQRALLITLPDTLTVRFSSACDANNTVAVCAVGELICLTSLGDVTVKKRYGGC